MTTARQAQSSRFQRGQGAYKCRICTRLTRDTGDNGAVTLCPQCYDLAGEENHLQDNGTFYSSPAEVERLMQEVQDAGGDIDYWHAAFGAKLAGINEAAGVLPTQEEADALKARAEAFDKCKHLLTPADAIKYLRANRRGRQFFVMVHNEAPIADKPGRVFSTCASVKVSHSDGVKYVQDAYAGFAERGAMVPITDYGNVLFIG